MPAVVWRIATDTPEYGSDDLSGKGPEITGGRWNRKGVPVVYAGSSRALACLETLVHVPGGDSMPLNRYLIEISIPPRAWKARTVFEPAEHVGWDAEPAGLVSLNWGTAWLESLSSLIAVVPSVIVPEELNVLINPKHAHSVGLRARKIRRWLYDFRLL